MTIIFDMLFSDGIGYRKEPIPGYLPSVICRWANVSEKRIINEWDAYKHIELVIDNDFNMSFRDLIKLISKGIHFDEEQVLMCQHILYVLVENELACIDNYDIQFKDFFEIYSQMDKLQVFFVFSQAQGQLFCEEGMRFYMRSNEQRHNKPHVHVYYKHEYAASFSILDGIKLAGNFPSKLQKEVKLIIEKNRDKLLDCWKKKTNGISVDINLSVLNNGSIEH